MEDAHEDGDDGAENEEGEESIVCYHPPAGGEGAEAHVEEDDADFGGGEDEVEVYEAGVAELCFDCLSAGA